MERNPDTWSQQLALAEFAANNAVHVATGHSAFFLNSGDHPRLPTSILHRGESSTVDAVQEMVTRMKTALAEAQANLTLAQNRARQYANRSRRDEQFEVGQEVVLSTRNLRVDEHLPTKLKRRWVGPFKISKVVSPVAYRLDLPSAWRIHPVFHASTLKAYHRSREFVREESPPPPILVDGVEEYEVEAILRHKGNGARRRYLVLWKDYPVTEAS